MRSLSFWIALISASASGAEALAFDYYACRYAVVEIETNEEGKRVNPRSVETQDFNLRVPLNDQDVIEQELTTRPIGAKLRLKFDGEVTLEILDPAISSDWTKASKKLKKKAKQFSIHQTRELPDKKHSRIYRTKCQR